MASESDIGSGVCVDTDAEDKDFSHQLEATSTSTNNNETPKDSVETNQALECVIADNQSKKMNDKDTSSVEKNDTQSNEVELSTTTDQNKQETSTSSMQQHDGDLKSLYLFCKRLHQNSTNSTDGDKSQTTDSILKLLVTEDMSSIRNSDVLKALFVEHLHLLPPKIISEILSVLIAIVKKSVFHLESARGLLIPSIGHLIIDEEDKQHSNSIKIDVESQQSESSSTNVSLTKHFLREWVNLLIAHSCDVEELKSILKFSESDPTLLSFIQKANLAQRNRPQAFFAFPGTKGSMMSLPPFQKWPIQVGWSFSTWFFLEPKACAQPYLYNFKTGKSGLGYSAHFTGNCLVLTSIRVKGKGVQHCVAYEFPSYKWIHCAITYHNKWRASEIKVYVNGQLSANIEMPWQVQTTEIFDKCFIGGSGSLKNNDRSAGELNCFCGQMSAVYLFDEGLSPTQICAIHRLGPSYMGQLKYSNESHVSLPPQVRKTLYEEKLASTLFCLFTPAAVDSGTLCIQLAPFKSSTTASARNYFISAPHAALLGQTKAISTQQICSTLQSIGCSRSLLPLLDVFARKYDSEACSLLVGFLCDLLESSPHWFANEIVQNNGFVIIACALASNARLLLSERLLDIFLNLTRTLLTTSTTVGDSLLLKHMMDNILLNPTLWIYADTKLQIKLYNYLATEFLYGTGRTSNKYTISNSSGKRSSSSFIAYSPTLSGTVAMSGHGLGYSANSFLNDDQVKSESAESACPLITDLLFGEVRRVSTVLQSLHALKYYYWVAEEKNINPKAKNHSLRPSFGDLITIRSHILQFTKELIVRANSAPLDEIQGILNYLSSCNDANNLLDIMDMVSNLLKEHPISMVTALDQKQGIKVIFTLIGSQSEKVRIQALKLLSLFLSQCSHKKKQDIMAPNNLFMLLCDKLSTYKPMTFETYEALMDIVLETDDDSNMKDQQSSQGSSRDMSKRRIENSLVIKVIATLLYEERNLQDKAGVRSTENLNHNNAAPDIRKIFINDLWNLIVCSKENRRVILQMSVWQHWLINLIDSTIEDSQLLRDQVLAIFRVLLYHAIRYEYGGWRVWIDTLAIIHTKVSYDEFRLQFTSPETSPLSSHSCEQGHKMIPRKLSKENLNSTPQVSSGQPTEDLPTSIEPNEKDDIGGIDVVDGGQHQNDQQHPVSSISQRIPRESSGLQMNDEEDDIENGQSNSGESKSKVDSIVGQMSEVNLEDKVKPQDGESSDTHASQRSLDSVDLAPSRAYRKISVRETGESGITESSLSGAEATNNNPERQHSLTSIPLEEESSNESVVVVNESKEAADIKEPQAVENAINDASVKNYVSDEDKNQNARMHPNDSLQNSHIPSSKAQASPAFRIPEFRWSNILIKLLNDLMFSIECDLYNWRCSSNCANLDTQPFNPKSMHPTGSSSHKVSSSSAPAILQLETLLQKPDNQIYIINIVHFVSQLADNIIIASGGLLPLLADATGGTRSSSTGATSTKSQDTVNKIPTCEGLTMPEANSLLYRLINMVDVVIFANSHINLGELEADKNTTSGGILRQCLRLACTVTVKNCLVVRNLNSKIAAMGVGGGYTISVADFPKDMFDSYQGCSLLSANGLFESSFLPFHTSDLIANVEYSPHQTPNTSSMPSLLPFQLIPVKDPNKLLQSIDINRLQACIYHDPSTESRQSQFLALSSLYFISVLMVSKYRDIIEPNKQQKTVSSKAIKGENSIQNQKPSESQQQTDSGFSNGGGSVSSIESNLLSFGKLQVNNGSAASVNQHSSSGNALTDMLTTKLENTLDSVCPLLKSIMCDFCVYLSKTLIGSHGQDLVNKEADRTFKRTNTSPVELVMLLCSQEWQNTLQKNAGLAFIELINEGRVLSHGMKDHIVRVAMEAEFIMSRLRADDVAKHEHFSLACAETQSARMHEEVLINSLISSATRRDYVVYCKFRESVQNQQHRDYKLDIWEDDNRRKRRFVIDSWDNSQQHFYTDQRATNTKEEATSSDKNDTKRILELQHTIELGGIDNHCLQTGVAQSHQEDIGTSEKVDDDCEEDESEEEDEDQPHDSNSPDSEAESSNRNNEHNKNEDTYDISEKQAKSQNLYTPGLNKSSKVIDSHHDLESEAKHNQVWDYDECGSVNDFTGSVIFAAECSLIWNIYAIPGVFQLTNHELYFEPNQNISDAIDALKRDSTSLEQDDQSTTKTNKSYDSLPSLDQINLRKIDLKVLRYCDFLICNGKIAIADIRAIFSRHYLLQPHALEIFLAQRTSVMFAFLDFETVKTAINHLPPVGVGIKYGIPQSRRASLMAPRQLFAASNMTQKWRKRDITNFEYLTYINTISGRTYQDLNQYPVFPWILTNYESDELDLNLPTNFRDLSKPVGALNNKRRSEFIKRYQGWDNPKVPAFHYGTHYSTAGFTLNWLCRLRGAPNSAYLAMQDGKFKDIFTSVGDSWVSSLVGDQRNGAEKIPELIPEFFYLPEMFYPNLGLPPVQLPPWAKSPEQFVRLHRLALESELVSCQLHQWIDLVFGYKQRGPEAINAVNTFYYLTYQGNVNLNMIQDPSLREAIETQIKHFGQTPSQLTTEPHPPKFSALHVSPMIFSSSADEVMVVKPSSSPIVHISSCIDSYITSNSSAVEGSPPACDIQKTANATCLTITGNNQYQIHKWVTNNQNGHPLIMDPQLEHSGSARRQLVDIEDLCSGISIKLNDYTNGTKGLLDEVQWPSAHYVVTLDHSHIICGSFYDNSFRVFTTESGKLCQVIYGHRGPITCIARSEGKLPVRDFYIATGSQDCSLLLWTWNNKYAQVDGSRVSAVHNPLPLLTISGHQTAVLSAIISAEMGIIISGSKSLVLVHATTTGENLLEINVLLPELLDKIPLECRAHLDDIIVQQPEVRDRQKTILEASMLSDQNLSSSLSKKVTSGKSSRNASRSPSLTSTDGKFSHLKELCQSDYYITNIQFARELGYIVCVALPPPRRKTRNNESNSVKTSAALLMTFNLKGSLMDCTTIGQAVSSPRLGDVCVLQMTKDGENLILNDTSTTLKIYQTFGLEPIYAYNTNDLQNTLPEDHSKVRALALVENHILCGLDNGKVVVYNANFKNL